MATAPITSQTIPPAIAQNIGWGWVMAYGVALVALAVIAFLWPFPATLATTLVAGALLVASGVAALIAAARHRGERRVYDIVSGAIGVLVGLYLVVWPLSGAITLTLVLAIVFGARGVTEILWGLRRRPRLTSMIVLGAVNIGLTVLIVATLPASALVLPGTLMAVSFLFTGIVAIMAANALRRAA